MDEEKWVERIRKLRENIRKEIEELRLKKGPKDSIEMIMKKIEEEEDEDLEAVH